MARTHHSLPLLANKKNQNQIVIAPNRSPAVLQPSKQGGERSVPFHFDIKLNTQTFPTREKAAETNPIKYSRKLQERLFNKVIISEQNFNVQMFILQNTSNGEKKVKTDLIKL